MTKGANPFKALVLFLMLMLFSVWNLDPYFDLHGDLHCARRESLASIEARRRQSLNPNKNKGLHETWDDYNRCSTRRANYGLYFGNNFGRKVRFEAMGFLACHRDSFFSEGSHYKDRFVGLVVSLQICLLQPIKLTISNTNLFNIL